MSAVLFHRIQDGFGLVAGCLEGGASNVAFLGILSNADCMRIRWPSLPLHSER